MQIRLSDGNIHEVFFLHGGTWDTIVNVDGFESRFTRRYVARFVDEGGAIKQEHFQTLAEKTLEDFHKHRKAA